MFLTGAQIARSDADLLAHQVYGGFPEQPRRSADMGGRGRGECRLHERGKMWAVESGFVPAADGVRLYFETHGQGDDHLVIPGAALVQDDLAPLAAGRTVVFFDTRNRGRSDPVPHDGNVGVPTEVDDIDTIRRHLGLERINLLGWSYVGLVAALYAARYSNHAERLVMVCPVPRATTTTALPRGTLASRPRSATWRTCANRDWRSATRWSSPGNGDELSCLPAWETRRPSNG
jgi:pimeloyl-ACP methyl ester carboxylesterase